MKRPLKLLGIFLTIILLTSCSVQAVSISPEDFDGECTSHCFKGVLIRDENGERIAHGAVLINTLSELKKLRKDYNIKPFNDGFSTINSELVEQLEAYSADYFSENVLLVLFVKMGSGSFDLSVESVNLDGDAVKAVLNCVNPSEPVATMDICYWCILVECKRVEGVTSAKWQYAEME